MKTALKTTPVILLGLMLVAYTGCAPQKNNTNSDFNVSSTLSSNIVGGVTVDQAYGNENGLVGLAIISQDLLGRRGMSLCTGTLIHKRIVLTAAHCVENSGPSNIVSVVAYFKPNINDVKKEDLIRIDKVLQHADFLKGVDQSNLKDQTAWNDIALLRLSVDAPSDVQLSKIPNKSDIIKINTATKLTLAGYGIATAIVNKSVKDPATGKIEIVPVTEKVNTSGILRKIENVSVIRVTADNKEIMINQKNSKGACHGDSGGPAFLKQTDGTQIQVGVTSRGTDKLGNCNKAAIFTGLIGQAEWLEISMTAILK